MQKTIGRAAYDAFRKHSLEQGIGLAPRWTTLPVDLKNAWEEIALAAVNQHIDDGLQGVTERLDAQMGESDG